MFRRRPFEAFIWTACFVCAIFSLGITPGWANAEEADEETTETTVPEANGGGNPDESENPDDSSEDLGGDSNGLEGSEDEEEEQEEEMPDAEPVPFDDAGFEDGSFSGWLKGSQTGTLGGSISGNGTGVSVFGGSKTFTHGSRGAVGSPTKNGEPNPYYAPAVPAGSWTFSASEGTYAALLQPKNEQTFSQAISALGLSGQHETSVRNQLIQDAQAAANGGSPHPTDSAWITRDVELIAGIVYTMSWNYLGTDYVPFNDGSITSLVEVEVPGNPVITVNNFTRPYALLGFTNPGTGDYSVNSYGATGWQVSTYTVSISGTYKLGFAVFNLGDTALSPVLMVDNEIGNTERCVPAGQNCETFGGVAPNNETAPSVSTTTTVPVTSTTTTVPVTSTTTTVPVTSTTTTVPVTSTTTTSTTTTSSTTTTVATPPQTTTTTQAPQTTTTTVYVAPTTTTTQVPAPTTTEAPPPTTTVPPTTTTVPETTTTTTVPSTTVPETTVPQPDKTKTPESTLPKKSETKTTLPNPDSVVVPDDSVLDPSMPSEQSGEGIKEPEAPTNSTQKEKESTTSGKTLPSVEIGSFSGLKAQEIVAAVSLLLESGIDSNQAQQLAAAPEVLNSIDAGQAQAIFEQIDPNEITQDMAEKVVSAVQDAPSEIRKVFENAVSLFQGAFDEYKMLNQNISVGQRRTVIAAGLLTAAASMPMPVSPSSGNTPSSSNNQDTASRRNDEEEEPSGEISGDGLDWVKKISIFKYVDGVKMMNWKAFFKKFSYGLMNMGFTIAGSLVVYLTLSGPIQKIAGISTVLAIAAAMWLHMKEPENE